MTTDEIRILKTGKCPSLSGKSELTYQIRFTPDSDIEVRIHANSSAGYFSNEWVSLKRVLAKMAKAPVGEITFFSLEGIYKGKSANNPGFLLAVLKKEGLVQDSSTKRRCYESVDPSKFFEKVKALLEAPPPPVKKTRAKRVTKEAVST